MPLNEGWRVSNGANSHAPGSGSLRPFHSTSVLTDASLPKFGSTDPNGTLVLTMVCPAWSYRTN